MDDIPEELMYLSISALKFSYSLSPSDMSVELKIGRMQIDNQVFNTPFPIVLFPVLSKVEGSETDFEPFLHFTAVKSTLKVFYSFFFSLSVGSFYLFFESFSFRFFFEILSFIFRNIKGSITIDTLVLEFQKLMLKWTKSSFSKHSVLL